MASNKSFFHNFIFSSLWSGSVFNYGPESWESIESGSTYLVGWMYVLRTVYGVRLWLIFLVTFSLPGLDEIKQIIANNRKQFEETFEQVKQQVEVINACAY